MPELTPFEYACLLRSWEKPADFLRAFQATADVLAEPVTVADAPGAADAVSAREAAEELTEFAQRKAAA